MEYSDFLELKDDLENVKYFLEKGYHEPKGKVDKVGVGFNVDGRFKACDGIELHYDSYRGSYGCSDCSTQLRIDNSKRFWKYFLMYLNENQFSILDFIADKMKEEMGKNTDAIKKKIAELNQILEDCKIEDKTEENHE
jgi:hypothetical protein